MSKNSTGAGGGTGEQAVEKIKRNEKLVASDVHSTARRNSLQPGLSDLHCDNGGISTATGSSSNSHIQVINNKERITSEITDSAGNKNYQGKPNSSRIHVQGAAVVASVAPSTSAEFILASSASSAVSSVTSSVVKNSSELTTFGEPTRKNVDSNQQTGDDRIRGNNSSSSSSHPHGKQNRGTSPESTLTDAGCRSPSAEVVVVVAGGEQESISYLFKGNSEEQTLLSSSQSSSSLVVVSGGPGATSSSSLSPLSPPEQKAEQGAAAPSSPARAGNQMFY